MNYFIFIVIIFLIFNRLSLASEAQQQKQEQAQPQQQLQAVSAGTSTGESEDELSSETRQAIKDQLQEFRTAADQVRAELRHIMATYADSNEQTKRMRRQSIDNMLARFRQEAAREKEIVRLYRSVQEHPDMKNKLAISRLKLLVKQRAVQPKDLTTRKLTKVQLVTSKANNPANNAVNAQQAAQNADTKNNVRNDAASPEPVFSSVYKPFNRVDLVQWMESKQDDAIDEQLFRKNLAIIHDGDQHISFDARNNLSHEANYKLSKMEQEESEKKKKPYTSMLYMPSIKRDVRFNPMNEIKLKTSTRLMRKGFGPSLPSYSLSETRREMMLDNMIKRLENDMYVRRQNENDTPDRWNMRLEPFEAQHLNYQAMCLGSNSQERKPQRTIGLDKHYYNMLDNVVRRSNNELTQQQSRLKRKTMPVANIEKPSKREEAEKAKVTAAPVKPAPESIAKNAAEAVASTESKTGTSTSEAKTELKSTQEVSSVASPAQTPTTNAATAQAVADAKPQQADKSKLVQCPARIQRKDMLKQQLALSLGDGDLTQAQFYNNRLRRAFALRKQLRAQCTPNYETLKNLKAPTSTYSELPVNYDGRNKRRARRDCAQVKQLRRRHRRRKRAALPLDERHDNNSDMPRLKRLFSANGSSDQTFEGSSSESAAAAREPLKNLPTLSDKDLDLLFNAMPASTAEKLKRAYLNSQMTIPAQITLMPEPLKTPGLTNEQLQLLQLLPQLAQQALAAQQTANNNNQLQPQNNAGQAQAQYQQLLALQQQVNALLYPQQQQLTNQIQNGISTNNALLPHVDAQGGTTANAASFQPGGNPSPVRLNLVMNAQFTENKTSKNLNGNGQLQVQSSPHNDDYEAISAAQQAPDTRERRTAIENEPITTAFIEPEKFPRRACTADKGIHGLISGKEIAEIVSKIIEHVRSNPELQVLSSSLQSNKPITKEQMQSFCAKRTKENESVRQHTEEVLQKAINKVTDIASQQARSCNNAPLRADLLQFYELILATYTDMEANRIKRNDEDSDLTDFVNEVRQMDPNKIQEKSHIVKKLLQQYEKLGSEEQQEVADIRNDLLEDLQYMRKLPRGVRYKRNHDDNEAADDAAELMMVVPLDVNNEAMLRLQQEEGLTPQYLRLIKTTELLRDVAMKQQ